MEPDEGLTVRMKGEANLKGKTCMGVLCVCVCVCVREGYTHTHTHTHTERERERELLNNPEFIGNFFLT